MASVMTISLTTAMSWSSLDRFTLIRLSLACWGGCWLPPLEAAGAAGAAGLALGASGLAWAAGGAAWAGAGASAWTGAGAGRSMAS